MTITEFLLARIVEDEELARASGSGEWMDDGTWYLEGVKHNVVGPNEVAFTHPEHVGHIARHDPARVLAECAAKRRILGDCLKSAAGREGDSTHRLAARTIKRIAIVYADHPDYQEEWRP